MARGLAPTAAVHGLKAVTMPDDLRSVVLATTETVNLALSSFMEAIDSHPSASLCLSLDAEWNMNRSLGVSLLQLFPHSEPSAIYLIPVHRFVQLPVALLRLLVSDRVFKIGSGIKGDLTRLKHQFPAQLGNISFSCIDLKDFAIQRGVVRRTDKGGLDALAETVLETFLEKDDDVRVNNDWETLPLRTELAHYASLDVYTS